MTTSLPDTERELSTSQGTPLVRVEGIWRQFRTNRGIVTALAGVDLDIYRGEVVCVVGPSGCGKSTLLALLAGLDKATAGSVTIGGAKVTGPHENLGVVFQRDLLLEWRTALDNVLLPYEIRGQRPGQRRNDALDLLGQVGLEGAVSRYPWQLSGGMRQRVAICRALVRNPELLLMDEPFGALDAITRDQLNVDVSRLAIEHRTTVAFITHDVDEAVFLGDRVVVMASDPGRVVGQVLIDSPRPRTLEWKGSPEFSSAVLAARRLLQHGETDS